MHDFKKFGITIEAEVVFDKMILCLGQVGVKFTIPKDEMDKFLVLPTTLTAAGSSLVTANLGNILREMIYAYCERNPDVTYADRYQAVIKMFQVILMQYQQKQTRVAVMVYKGELANKKVMDVLTTRVLFNLELQSLFVGNANEQGKIKVHKAYVAYDCPADLLELIEVDDKYTETSIELCSAIAAIMLANHMDSIKDKYPIEKHIAYLHQIMGKMANDFHPIAGNEPPIKPSQWQA